MTDRATALRPVVQAAFDAGGIDAVCELITSMEARFEARIAQLEARIAELEKRLNKNSSNSSKPPSSDGLKRKSSLRNNESGRKPGGQPGHSGQHLEPSANPDVVIELPPPEQCPHCQCDLTGQSEESVEVRQVFDLPPLNLHVTEYRTRRKKCPGCGKQARAEFPAGVNAPTQYGLRMQAAMTYLGSVGNLVGKGNIVP